MFLVPNEGFPGGSVVKNPPANAKHPGLIPGLGRFPGEGNGNHSSILAWKIPWTEELGRLQSMGWQSSTLLSTHECTHASSHSPEASQVEWEQHGR